MESSDYSTFTKGIGISFIAQVVGTSFELASHVLLARMLGPDVYGIYALGWGIIRMTRLLSGLGLQQGTIRYGVQYYPHDPAGLKDVLYKTIGMSLS